MRIWRSTELSYTTFGDFVFTTVLNLADSFRVFVYSYEIVEYNGVLFGLTWLGPLSGLIPFLQGFLVRSGLLNTETLNSPNVFTLYKHNSLNLSGEGSTIAADLFLNFGSIGVFIGMLILGVCFKKSIFTSPFNSSITASYSSLVLVAFSLYISRSSLLYPLKFIVWGGLIHILLYNISKLRINE